jgi:hypothetical protein
MIKTERYTISGFWSKLYALPVANEPFVGRIHLIEILEDMSRYSTRGEISYFQRLQQSLETLPKEHREAALLIFSRVLYFPAKILDEMWKYLWFALRQYATGGMSERELLTHSQLFEVDPSGMISQFVHLNGLAGRLDTTTNARASDITDMVTLLLHLSNNSKQIRNHAIEELELLLKKRYWIVLTDKSLSGQSLANDLRRYIQISEFFNSTFKADIEVVVLCQMITTYAREFLERRLHLARHRHVSILSATELDDSCRMNSDKCQLVVHKEQRDKVRSLCEWFARTYIRTDDNLGRMRQQSGDDLPFGYRGCGLTVCDSNNCPTDSLPLMWYGVGQRRGDAKVVPPYYGPYIRIHSRIGNQTRKPLLSGLRSISIWKAAARQYLRKS